MAEAVIGVAGPGEALGVQEIIESTHNRLHSVLVKSEGATLL